MASDTSPIARIGCARAGSIHGDDPGRFLPAMLQGVEPEMRERSRIRGAEHSKDSTHAISSPSGGRGRGALHQAPEWHREVRLGERHVSRDVERDGVPSRSRGAVGGGDRPITRAGTPCACGDREHSCQRPRC